MRTEAPIAVQLSDYSSYPFEIEQVDLRFDLHPDATRVRADLKVRRTGDANAPLELDGEALELKSIAIDGVAVPDDAYQLTETGLTLAEVPDAFTLVTEVEIAPSKNTALSGLYMSGDRFCTQCEAIGFRRITFYPDRPDVMSRFTVRMTADKATYPILLSNGTPGEAGDVDDGRHFAVWDDPHKKPAYLFALCAGDYDVYSDQFTTMSGKTIDLAIHVDKGDADRAAWAMDSLKRSMKWDEETYGREYDLGVFNIVAVRDFNFGAMENKGLNIFNSAYVLADEDTATDADFEAIESIVAHEYFHNWTGNRITCRDWFQLCLKEGLTVFRDQNFSADMRSRPVQRIKDVIRLRARQFAEDAGPLAHPVRPTTYGAIDNLYTATVYEKGAEIIGMLRRMLGEETYRKGMDLYFDRHDGQAVTIEDFYACFEEVSEQDFAQFRLWYSQAGTPEITMEESWNPETREIAVTLKQKTPATPGQPAKKPMLIPMEMALIDDEGNMAEWITLLEDEELTMTFDLPEGSERPLVSINRDFTAPVRIKRALSRDDQLAMIRLETDPFNQWDSVQNLAKQEILALSEGSQAEPDDALVEAMAVAIRGAVDDPAFASLLTRLPDVGELFQERQPADPVALNTARKKLQAALYSKLSDFVDDILAKSSPEPYDPGAEQAGERALRTALINLLAASGHDEAGERLLGLYNAATNMTEKLAALRGLAGLEGAARETALADFERTWKSNPLVMDKWFGVQAGTGDAATVSKLAAHPDFDMGNPNRVRSVAAAFAMQNLSGFHAPDGSGYEVIEGIILKADKVNPALGARLLTAFEQWRILEPKAKAEAEACLRRLQAADLSKNSADIVSRALS
ncbi:MAG TPA: aminopeptidase N [Hyphomonas sp.]|jgi:aminopeptidase N|uniref:aminopeptidase N n=2 Tax=Hyphomonas TaxID=85 RepID=UPI000C38ABB2|nr:MULTISPECIES: aminopeptidase N [unclassified Hyphomonas]MAL43089.1 aminopeptidase N [Hyphomonas sp.]MAX83356.1 aminopeptidase N [Hyphomonas sp.]HAW56174.1 aminopeptidase N [Hyphomonas sp.]HBN94129.1 aminopeptidase N [Hyphomonas sp.]HBU32947.1 aminopeptidase N [Hyphomonas sp.]|tara:strand:- start:2539 stop:5115 length:2577 start_codon:yes stop_codon:yes gene_type:complete